MNDRDPFSGVDPTGDPIDRTLSQAFRSRPTPSMSQPSLIDVRHRARRRQQRRSAGLVGAIVLVGAGGVGAYALRNDGDSGRAALTPGDDASGSPVTTVECTFFPDSNVTTVPAILTSSTVSGPGAYTVQDGDTPALVAQKFNVTVDELNTANAGLPGYDAFYVGLVITIPGGMTVQFMPGVAPTTTGLYSVPGPCSGTGGTWHCSGELGVDEFGRPMFQSCEYNDPSVVPTTVPGSLPGFSTTTITVPVETTTVGNPAGTTTTLEPTTVSVNGNASTTTSLG